MNYPVRNAIISFVKFGDSECLYNTLTEIYSTYPKAVSDCLMNIIGTHDTERILTVLGGEDDIGYVNAELAAKKMTSEEKDRAKKLLKIASMLQFTVYGIPSLYYGDEAGMEGYHDPFCRYPFPWGQEDAELVEHYKKLGALRDSCNALNAGDFSVIERGESYIVFERKNGNSRLITAANMGSECTIRLDGEWTNALTSEKISGVLTLGKESAVILTAI